jgi:hypothetical protein
MIAARVFGGFRGRDQLMQQGDVGCGEGLQSPLGQSLRFHVAVAPPLQARLQRQV